jgi:tetratricopeptide (TPR) repeat protein
MTVMGVYASSQRAAFLLLLSIAGAVVILATFHIIRVLFGGVTILNSLLPSATSTLVGSWNDLGILVAMTVGVLLVALVQLPLAKHVAGLMTAIIALLLFVLAMVNFPLLWFGLGFFSLALLLYTLTRDRFTQQSAPLSLFVVGAVGIVTIVSGLFIISGASLGQAVNQVTGTSYLEVRPSFGATIEIAQQAIRDNVLFGTGPNHFADAWRIYRDPAIITTSFWNVDFVSGSGYIPTWFVTTGSLGVLAWFVFLLTFLYSGVRVLLVADASNTVRYFIASASFLLAASAWILSFLYVPGASVLIVGAIATGLLFASARALGVYPRFNMTLLVTRRTSFALICVTLCLIVSSVWFLSTVVRQTTALTTYAELATLTTDQNQFETAVAVIASAYQTYPRPVYLRDIISLQLNRLNQLLALPEPSEAEQQEFQALVTNTVEVATENVERPNSEALDWLLLGDAFQVLTALAIEGASDRALEAYEQAKTLDPLSPLYDLRRARIFAQRNDIESARTAGQAALQQKANYVEALVFLTELEIATGNVTPAIQSVRSLIAIEPRNPRLYYQLGVLLLADQDATTALNAFTDALALDPVFANARYVRALILAEQGNRSEALTELRTLLADNQDNDTLRATITLIEDETATIRALDLITPVAENQPTIDQDTVLSTEAPDTDLLTPVNQLPPSTESSESTTNQSGDAQETLPETSEGTVQ